MLDFLYVRDPKNKYAGSDIGTHKTVPFLRSKLHTYDDNAKLLANHLRLLEIVDQSGNISEILKDNPGDSTQKEFFQNKKRHEIHDILETSYLFARAQHLFDSAHTQGTFDNVSEDLDSTFGQLYGLCDSYWKLAGSIRQYNRFGLTALMRREKKALTIPQLDEHMSRESGINAKPDFERLEMVIAYDSNKNDVNRRYGLYRTITCLPNSRAKATLGRVYGNKEDFSELVKQKLGHSVPIYVVKEKRTIPYFLRRHFVEHLVLRPDIDDYFSSTREL